MKTIYHRLKFLNKTMTANYRRGIGPARLVMLLTTVGRKSGLPRVTPLQYEEINGDLYVASARGKEADWYKNLVAHPSVHIQIGGKICEAIAEPVTDPIRIADFVELRKSRHPVMISLIMFLFDGFPLRFNRKDLEEYCKDKALVIIRPMNAVNASFT